MNLPNSLNCMRSNVVKRPLQLLQWRRLRITLDSSVSLESFTEVFLLHRIVSYNEHQQKKELVEYNQLASLNVGECYTLLHICVIVAVLVVCIATNWFSVTLQKYSIAFRSLSDTKQGRAAMYLCLIYISFVKNSQLVSSSLAARSLILLSGRMSYTLSCTCARCWLRFVRWQVKQDK